MKRKLSTISDASIALDIIGSKRENLNKAQRRPSSYVLENAPILSHNAALIINSIWERKFANEMSMHIDTADAGKFVFMFFLDAQGKEQIGAIREMILLFTETAAIFVSLNIDTDLEEDSSSIAYLDSSECKLLARELCLLDPVGGGNYPLNYLMIIDPHLLVRYQVPLKFSHCYGAYQKFGLQLPHLLGLIEEYSSFATTT